MAVLQLLKRIFSPICFLIFISQINNPCYSQSLVSASNPNEEILLVRTKQFTEFINRFNFTINFNGDPVDSVFASKIPREKMINSLFDLKDPRIDRKSKSYSGDYNVEKSEFINDVVSKNLLIYRYSDKIIAEAKSRILIKGIPKEIRIFLSQEIVGKDMVKWVITTIKSDLFDFLKKDTVFIRFIPPSSNETDFMNLKRALEDTDYLQYYASKDYNPDNLTLFYYLLNSGAIKFDYVEEVIYHIIDLPRWAIKVREFNRNDMNSGWLITDLTKNSDDKINYLKKLR
jgi:hypothetical protein